MFNVLNQKKRLIGVLAVLLGASLLLWIPIVGRFSLQDPQPVPVPPSAINEDPAPFLGRRVRVEGEVERIYGPRAFSLECDSAAACSLLVVGGKPWTLLQKNPQVNELIRNDHVQVMGRVRKFRLREYQELSGQRAGDSLLAAWEGRPALMALDLELTPGVPDFFPGGDIRKGRGGSAGPDDTASDTASSHPDSLYGFP